MSLHVLGVRHHGPGCARSVGEALDRIQPDAVLVEGPPDADELIPLAADATMVPPVALLVLPADAPQRAVFYPFAAFSPEWVAIRWALAHGVAVRFMDLPQAHALAEPPPAASAGSGDDEEDGDAPDAGETDASAPPPPRPDPIGGLARAAGFQDGETWWEHEIERRRDATGLFEALREAMAALRDASPPEDAHGLRREAHMRQTIRAARREGRERIAVVCGAWHAPALHDPGPAKPDAELLKGLPRTKVSATWIPWTHSRLSYRSGYGAGVASPGWYAHLWTAPDRASTRWAAQAARLLREQDLVASSAGVIDAVRLADALASMRGLNGPGLDELSDAIRATLCHGDAAPMDLVRRRLEIGESLGTVPEAAPAPPLQRDAEARLRTLRVKASADAVLLDLDLRKENDRERSRLFHRFAVLSVPFATRRAVQGATGTFHEPWDVAWRPETLVALIAASVHGTTVASAASAAAIGRAAEAPDLRTLTALLDVTFLADLPEASAHVLGVVRDRSAAAADVREILDSLPPLARAARYGDVRGTASADVLPVFDTLLARALAGLGGACASLDDEAAASMRSALAEAQASLDLLERHERIGDWRAALLALADRPGVHGRVRGGCCRLLLDAGVLDAEGLALRAGLALGRGTPPADAAAWLEGLVAGGALTLLRAEGVWRALDGWLATLPDDAFVAALPLLRRAFASFEPAERRSVWNLVRSLGGAAPAETARAADPLVAARADLVLPVLARILGGAHAAG